MKRALCLAGLAASALSACYDPVHDDAVDALGGEAAGVRPGPTHRPGQPCMTCHGGRGPGSPDFAVAGTVFAVRGGTAPSVGALVTLTDATSATRRAQTNAAGNFFVPADQWSPTFPLRVVLDAGGAHKVMITAIGRDGSCAACHRGGGDNAQMPGVFLRDQ